jgi:hypothetical protein
MEREIRAMRRDLQDKPAERRVRKRLEAALHTGPWRRRTGKRADATEVAVAKSEVVTARGGASASARTLLQEAAQRVRDIVAGLRQALHGVVVDELVERIWADRVPIAPIENDDANNGPDMIVAMGSESQGGAGGTTVADTFDFSTIGCEVTFQSGFLVFQLATQVHGFWDTFRARVLAECPAALGEPMRPMPVSVDDPRLHVFAVYCAALSWADSTPELAFPLLPSGERSPLSFSGEAFALFARILNRTNDAGAAFMLDILLRFAGHMLWSLHRKPFQQALLALRHGGWAHRVLSGMRSSYAGVARARIDAVLIVATASFAKFPIGAVMR